MGDGDDLFVHRVVVLPRRHLHRLRRIPVAGGEGQRGVVEGQVGVCDASDGHRYVSDGLGVQHHRVRVRVSLLYVERGLRYRHPCSVVVRDGDRDAGGGQTVVFGVTTRSDGVLDGNDLFVYGVVVLPAVTSTVCAVSQLLVVKVSVVLLRVSSVSTTPSIATDTSPIGSESRTTV